MRPRRRSGLRAIISAPAFADNRDSRFGPCRQQGGGEARGVIVEAAPARPDSIALKFASSLPKQLAKVPLVDRARGAVRIGWDASRTGEERGETIQSPGMRPVAVELDRHCGLIVEDIEPVRDILDRALEELITKITLIVELNAGQAQGNTMNGEESAGCKCTAMAGPMERQAQAAVEHLQFHDLATPMPGNIASRVGALSRLAGADRPSETGNTQALAAAIEAAALQRRRLVSDPGNPGRYRIVLESGRTIRGRRSNKEQRT